MLKSKIHRARITGTELDYEGSITIDPELLVTADRLLGEQVRVLNLNNRGRFITYTIAALRGSGPYRKDFDNQSDFVAKERWRNRRLLA
jgi:aspartate 1-decarboxylase